MKITVVVIFFTMIFSSVSQAVDTQVLPFQSNEIYELVKPELSQRSVWYEDLGSNKIKVNASDIDLIFRIAEETIQKIIPNGRSRSPAKNILKQVILQLERDNIPFSVRCFDNTKWLVWESQYTQRVESIFDEARSSISPENFGGMATCT